MKRVWGEEFGWENLRERNHLEDLCLDVNKLLK
jgi:hypothetical protein